MRFTDKAYLQAVTHNNAKLSAWGVRKRPEPVVFPVLGVMHTDVVMVLVYI